MNRELPRHYTSSEELRKTVLGTGDGTALLSFSCGKDAVASWLALRDAGFTRIVPFYLYLVPDLAFVEDAVRYYEDAFGAEILRVPHPSLPRMLRNLVFQPPERAAILERLAIPSLTYAQVEAHVRARAGAGADAFVAVGTRTADSPIRLANVRRYGSLNPTRRSFFPIFDWKIADVKAAITKAALKLPVDYRLFGRSFDGIDWRFLAPIREHFPDDYRRILDWFPLAELELVRRQLGGSPPAPPLPPPPASSL